MKTRRLADVGLGSINDFRKDDVVYSTAKGYFKLLSGHLLPQQRGIALLNDLCILLQNVLETRLELFVHLQFSVSFEQRNWVAAHRDDSIDAAVMEFSHTISRGQLWINA
jgi:hypothetical protein